MKTLFLAQGSHQVIKGDVVGKEEFTQVSKHIIKFNERKENSNSSEP